MKPSRSVLALAMTLSAASAAEPIRSFSAPYEAFGEIERLDPALDRLLAPGVTMVKLAEGFNWSEGPVWMPKEQQLIFSDVPENIAYRWREGHGVDIFLQPSGLTTTITAIDSPTGPVAEAYPPMSVTLRLADDIDIARGDLICRPNNAPAVAQNVEALICWMDETRPLTVGGKYAIKHTTRAARAVVRGLNYRLDINSLHRDESATEYAISIPRSIGPGCSTTACPASRDCRFSDKP